MSKSENSLTEGNKISRRKFIAITVTMAAAFSIMDHEIGTSYSGYEIVFV